MLDNNLQTTSCLNVLFNSYLLQTSLCPKTVATTFKDIQDMLKAGCCIINSVKALK